MIDEIISNIEKTKNEILGEMNLATVQESHSLDGPCPACGGDEFWQPKRSDEWICRSCRPPRSESLVAQTRGGHRIAQGDQNASPHLEGLDTRWAQNQGFRIVWHPFPVCVCGSDVTEELWSIYGADKICRGCGQELFFDEFVGLQSGGQSRLEKVK